MNAAADKKEPAGLQYRLRKSMSAVYNLSITDWRTINMTMPLQISPETAIKLSKELNVPIEHLMHMPKHILLQKLAELAKKEQPDGGEQQS